MFEKIKENIKKKKEAREASNKDNINESENEQIVSQLLSETVGEGGSISELFEKLIEGYNASTNPLGKEDAERILLILINQAVAERRKLALRVARSLEYGSHYEYYNGRIREIDQYTEDAFLAMKEMQRAREDYEYQNAILDKVTAKSYTPDVVPEHNGKNFAEEQEIWEEMDKEGNNGPGASEQNDLTVTTDEDETE